MNNFDESSSGTNIELSVGYDRDLASMYYEYFATENTRLEFARDSSVFLLGDVTKPYYKKSELTRMKKADLIDIFDNFDLGYYNDELSKMDKIDLIDCVIGENITIKKYYEYLISQYSWNSISEHINHSYYISHGYSQGDAIYIISIDEELTDGYKKYIDNILWDCPVYISLTIDDVEYKDDELLNDMYEYDKNSVIEKVKLLDITEHAKEWIADNLPNEPKYNY